MKKTFFLILFLANIVLFAQTFTFQSTIESCTEYAKSSISIKDNRLFFVSPALIQEYTFNNSGNLFLEREINQKAASSTQLIHNDTLYVADTFFNDNSILFGYNLENGNFTKTFEKELNYPLAGFPSLKANNNYLFCKNFSSGYSYIYNIHNLTLIDSIIASSIFEVTDNYLFTQVFDQNNSYLYIEDITDIQNPNHVSSYPLNTTQYVRNIKYLNNRLYVLLSSKFMIFDLSNIFHPVLISEINYFPEQLNNATMIDFVFFENFVFLYDDKNYVWIYEYDNTENLEFVRLFTDYNTSYTSFDNILPRLSIDPENKIMFFSNATCRLSSFDISNLPEITLIETKGIQDGYYWIYFQKFNRFLFYSKIHHNKRYLSYYDTEQNYSTLLYDNGFTYNYPSENDSIFCFFKYIPENDEKTLSFYKIQNNNLTEFANIPFQPSDGAYGTNFYRILGNNLLVFNTHQITIKSLEENNFGETIGNIIPGVDNFFLVPRNKNIYPEYIFVYYNQNNLTKIKIYNNTPPFDEVTEFYALFPDYYKPYLLSENLLLRESADNTKFLCSYTFPNHLEILDTMEDTLSISSSLVGSYSCRSDILWEDIREIATNHNKIKFIPIVNNRFGTPFEYDFGVEIESIFFFPEQHKFYAMGRYYIQEYSYQLNSSEDDFITPITKPVLTNYPNPFNPSTTISFNLQKAGKDTKIAIYNLKGQKVRELKLTNAKIGENKIIWNGKDDSGKKVASGVYLYSLIQDGKLLKTKKMVMVK